jgi:transposase
MRDISLLQLALGLAPPWTVTGSDFDAEARRLDIHLDFTAGSRFTCPGCGAADCPAHDTERMTWRHLNFFQHQAYLHARVPRVRCVRCGVKKISVPWAREGGGFTLLFEALVMALVSAMPVNAVARLVGEHDTRLWRVIHHYVERARARTDLAAVTRVAIDETAARRGHHYISLFVDIDRARVVFATEGKDAATVAAFADDLTAHGGDPDAVAEVCIDMSPAFIKGTADSLANAAITFDKFHAVKIINDAVDQVRRTERKDHKLLAGTRYLWLRNPDRLSSTNGLPSKAYPCVISRLRVPTKYDWPSRNFTSNHPPSPEQPSSGDGISGRPTLGCRRSSTPPAPSNVTRTAFYAGSTARSPTVSSRESIASSRPPRPRLAAIVPFEISPPWSISSPES